MPKIVMICNTDGALYNFRLPLIKLLQQDNYDVTTISSGGKYIEKLKSEVDTAYFIEFNNSLNPYVNIKLIINLIKILKKEKPDIVHTFTHKANIFGAFATWISGYSNTFLTVTGMGKIYTFSTLKYRIIQIVINFLYRIITKKVVAIFFQNPDDLGYMLKKNIINENQAVLTNGSAIDLDEFKAPTQEEINESRKFIETNINISVNNKIITIFPARAIPEKGIDYFYQTSKYINRIKTEYIFIHLGGPYEGSRYNESFLTNYAKECGVYYLGYRTDIKTFLTAADIILLPSFYREGVPHSLIEGLALKKVIITTDTPGCRETVIDNWNGYLVKSQDLESILNVFKVLDKMKIHEMKENSRKLCEDKFDIKQLFNTTANTYNRKKN